MLDSKWLFSFINSKLYLYGVADVDRLTDGFPFNNMESAHEKDEPNCPFCFVVSLIIGAT